jgi:competence protein ComEC
VAVSRGWGARRLWVPALLGWVVGTLAQLAQPALWPLAAYGALAAAGLAWLALAVGRWHHVRGATVAVGGAAALLAFATTGGRAVGHTQRVLAPAWDGATVQAVWRVQDMPARHADGVVFDATLLSAHTPQGDAVPVAGIVRLSWRWAPGGDSGAGPPRLMPGQTWRGWLRLRAPRGLANPYGFDAETWLWREGVAATGSVLQGGRWAAAQPVGDDPWRYPVARARTGVRDAIVERLAARHGAAATGLIAALVTGDQGAIPAADWAAIRATGVAHLVAISGLHVTMFAMLATAVVGVVWRAVGRRWPRGLLACPVPIAAGVGGVGLALAYALFAGWGVPAQRTVTMLAVVVALQLGGRRWPWPVVWLAAMAAALVIDPWAVLQPGFWLSFVAVGVLFGLGPGPVPEAGTAARAWLAMRQLLTVQALITVALAPLTLLLFGQVSLVGLLANAVAIPGVTLVLTPLALAGVVLPPLWDGAARLAQALLALLHGMADWPWAVWERPAVPLPLAALACLGAVVLVWRLPWRWRTWGLWLLWPALAFRPPAPAHGAFEVLLPDVGQGSAAIVRTARHTLVFDSGPPLGRSDAAERVLLPWLRALGEEPAAIVISHDDSDHAGGMATLARHYPDALWWASFDVTARVSIPAQRCLAGTGWEWDGVRFVFLHPPSLDYGVPGPDGDNTRSCVLWVSNGQQAALLTGDITQAEEAALIAAYPQLRTDLLVAAHHGSRTSTSAAWLEALQPTAVAIQSGWRNRYGHPHPDVVQRLQQRAIAWADTATCGAITWRSDASTALTCERQRVRRYWLTPASN